MHAAKIKPAGFTLNNLGNAFLLQGQFTQAAQMYWEALRLQPHLSTAHNGLGKALHCLGNYQAAEAHCRRALELEPTDWNARINVALVLVDLGRCKEALDHASLLWQFYTLPRFPLKSYGLLLARAGLCERAKVCFQHYLANYSKDPDGVDLLLAAMGGGELPLRASSNFLQKLYASRAQHWDQGSIGLSGYQGAKLVAAEITNLNSKIDNLELIDAGCGTGLVGELLREDVGTLLGVDLSLPMLQQARNKNVYDGLHHCDLIDFLNDRPGSCDVITSAATLIHFGNLESVFKAARRSLRPRGAFVFTVFPNEQNPNEVAAETFDGYGQGGCYKHGENYIARTAASCDFEVVSMKLDAHEYVHQQPKMVLVAVLKATTFNCAASSHFNQMPKSNRAR